MEDLIKALNIMLKNGDVKYPTHCIHDELRVFPKTMDFSEEDISELEVLGFHPEYDEGELCSFYSFRYGSC